MHKQTILITGSNGLLGQKLVHALGQRPDDFIVFGSGKGSNRLQVDYANFSYHTLDITNKAEVIAALDHLRPDVVINTAAMTNVDQCETEKDACRALNVDAVSYLVKACESIGAFLLHLSTDFIFDGEAGPYLETDLPNPLSFYGHSKLDAETIVRAASCKWAIARTVLVYGIADDMSRTNIVLWVKKSLEEGKSINVVNDQFRSPTLAEDLAQGCILIAHQKAEGIYNISGEEVLTPYLMALETADFFKLDKTLIVETDGSKFSQAAKRPPRTGFIIEKAKHNLGYKPHTFMEGIAVLAAQVAAKG